MRFLYTCLLISYSFSLFGQISFQERATQKNVDHSLKDWTIGGGTSVYDFNGDGLDDLTLATDAGEPLAFYLNKGTNFELLPPLVDNQELVKQILWADYDNDGDADLYIAAFDGINRFYENKGELNFVEITESAGFPMENHRGFGACWGDYNRDGWLDLYYTSRAIPGTGKNRNRLFQNNADGTFTEVTDASNTSDENRLPFCAAFLDYNNDKWPDIYIANDKKRGNTLLENNGDLTFRNVGVATKANLRMDAMCVNSADINKDGWLDIYVTNIPEGNKMLLNQPSADGLTNTFEEVADALGIGFYGIGWGSNFFDADNDGDLDLYVSASNLTGGESISSAFYENVEPQQFEKLFIPGMLKDTAYSFSNSIGDFNNDGFIDIIVQNNPPFDFYLWENTTVVNNRNKWLKFRLEGVKSNRDAIGAKIESYVNSNYQSSYTFCGFGFLGQNSYWQHIGLGNNDQLDSLIITWPTGHIDKFYQLTANQSLTFKEGQSTNGEIQVDSDITLLEGNFSTNTTEIKSEFSVQAYPNPSAQQLTITSEIPFSNLAIFDIHGRLILEQYSSPSYKVSIDISKLEKGTYWLETRGRKGNASLKWVKQ